MKQTTLTTSLAYSKVTGHYLCPSPHFLNFTYGKPSGGPDGLPGSVTQTLNIEWPEPLLFFLPDYSYCNSLFSLSPEMKVSKDFYVTFRSIVPG